MIAQIEEFHESGDCTWCGKANECVELSFADGFLKHAVLCWKCAQQSVRVYQSQTTSDKPTPKTSSD